MIRFAVLGVDRIGKVCVANVAANAGSQFVAIAYPIEEAAHPSDDRLGCEASTDAATVIDREDIDTIITGTPTYNHVDLMMRAVNAGRAVVCEKPIDLSLATVGEAVAEIERHVALATIAFNRGFALHLADVRCNWPRPAT